VLKVNYLSKNTQNHRLFSQYFINGAYFLLFYNLLNYKDFILGLLCDD